jgi:hypothetical protein
MVIKKSTATLTHHCLAHESFSMYLKSKVEHLVDHVNAFHLMWHDIGTMHN